MTAKTTNSPSEALEAATTPETPEPTSTPQSDPKSAQNGPQAPPAQSGDDDAPETEGNERPQSEAARWRRKLRDAEAQRDDLAERLATAQRAEAARLAESNGLLIGSDIFDIGRADLADLLDDGGAVDAAAVAAAVAALRAERPQLVSTPDTGQGRRGGQSPTGGATWSGAVFNKG